MLGTKYQNPVEKAKKKLQVMIYNGENLDLTGRYGEEFFTPDNPIDSQTIKELLYQTYLNRNAEAINAFHNQHNHRF